MKTTERKTIIITIYIAGDLDKIKDTCREFCLEGLCVTVTPTEYIYTGGAETGAAIGLINYPRFSCSEVELKNKARRLAALLLKRCHQRSCTIVCGEDTLFVQNDSFEIPK